MSKKYKLINKNEEGMFRVIALKDFGNVREGDVGGIVEGEYNLSQEGNCWIYGDAQVYGNARVSGDAQVHGKAEVFDNAGVSGYAEVFGDARVFGNAEVYGDALVHGKARVYDEAMVHDRARVFGTAVVHGIAIVYRNTELYSGVYDKNFDSIPEKEGGFDAVVVEYGSYLPNVSKEARKEELLGLADTMGEFSLDSKCQLLDQLYLDGLLTDKEVLNKVLQSTTEADITDMQTESIPFSNRPECECGHSKHNWLGGHATWCPLYTETK